MEQSLRRIYSERLKEPVSHSRERREAIGVGNKRSHSKTWVTRGQRRGLAPDCYRTAISCNVPAFRPARLKFRRLQFSWKTKKLNKSRCVHIRLCNNCHCARLLWETQGTSESSKRMP